jgi:hypothetical protein
MKYTVEIAISAMIHISSPIKTGSAIQMLMAGIHRHTDSAEIA